MTARRAKRDEAERLTLYRRSARALNQFYGHWTHAFCARCLEVTRRHHRDDPRADVDLLEGIFSGCCHSGVADAFWIPGRGEEGRFPPRMQTAMERGRDQAASSPLPPLTYQVRERQTGRLARGIACVHLRRGGCQLGDLKGPLCLTYLCDPVRSTLAAAADWRLVGVDSDNFCGSRQTLAAVVCESYEAAVGEVRSLNARLTELDRRLAASGVETGLELYGRWERSAALTSRRTRGRALPRRASNS